MLLGKRENLPLLSGTLSETPRKKGSVLTLLRAKQLGNQWLMDSADKENEGIQRPVKEEVSAEVKKEEEDDDEEELTFDQWLLQSADDKVKEEAASAEVKTGKGGEGSLSSSSSSCCCCCLSITRFGSRAARLPEWWRPRATPAASPSVAQLSNVELAGVNCSKQGQV